jgi:hypothetical protein
MSRSLHTDPYALRAARRVVAPYRRRPDEPRVARRRARLSATLDTAAGAAKCSPGGPGGPPARVDVRVCPPRPGFFHPAGVDDVTRLLAFFGPPAVYGLRRVELRQRVGDNRCGLLVAGLKVPGMVVLFEQPPPPWMIAARLTVDSLQRLQRAGAHIQMTATQTRIDWPAQTLRDFVLLDGLMHEIGHHMLQHNAGKRVTQAMRTADHERCADAFAAACRRAWTTSAAPR